MIEMADLSLQVKDTHATLKFTIYDTAVPPAIIDFSSGVTGKNFVIRPDQEDELSIAMTFETDGSDGKVNVQLTTGALNVGDQECRVHIDWTAGTDSYTTTLFTIKGLS